MLTIIVRVLETADALTHGLLPLKMDALPTGISKVNRCGAGLPLSRIAGSTEYLVPQVVVPVGRTQAVLDAGQSQERSILEAAAVTGLEGPPGLACPPVGLAHEVFGQFRVDDGLLIDGRGLDEPEIVRGPRCPELVEPVAHLDCVKQLMGR